MLKIHICLRRIISLVMILTVIQTGFLGSSSPVLAQSGDVVSNTVYEDNTLPDEVATDVYGGTDNGLVPRPAINFLKEESLDQLSGPSGKFNVSGQVTENSTGMPLAEVSVKLLLNGHPTQFKTTTDSQGSYTIQGVGLESYQLTFRKSGYTPEEFSMIFNGADVRQDCSLFRNTSFQGQVVNELGDSLEQVQVILADQNTPNRYIDLSTDGDGWFYLVDVPPGRYKVSVSQSVYNERKTVWVDEYPQELSIILRGAKPLSQSVPEEVYENPATDVSSNEQPSEVEEGNNDSPNVEDEANEQPTEVEDKANEQPAEVEDTNSDTPKSASSSTKKEPFDPLSKWSPIFVAYKEDSPLTELEQLLKWQAFII